MPLLTTMLIAQFCDKNSMRHKWKGRRKDRIWWPLKREWLNWVLDMNSQSTERTQMSQAIIFPIKCTGSARARERVDFLVPHWSGSRRLVFKVKPNPATTTFRNLLERQILSPMPNLLKFIFWISYSGASNMGLDRRSSGFWCKKQFEKLYSKAHV